MQASNKDASWLLQIMTPAPTSKPEVSSLLTSKWSSLSLVTSPAQMKTIRAAAVGVGADTGLHGSRVHAAS